MKASVREREAGRQAEGKKEGRKAWSPLVKEIGQNQHIQKPEIPEWLCVHTDEGRGQLSPASVQKNWMLSGTSLFEVVLYFTVD